VFRIFFTSAGNLWGVYTIQQTSSISTCILEVYWTFAGACKHPFRHKQRCCANVSV